MMTMKRKIQMAISEAVPRIARTKTAAPSAKAGEAGPIRPDDMVNLYCSVLRAVPDVTCRVVEIIATSRGEGVSTIARALASAAAAAGNARVLLCDASPDHDDFKEAGIAQHASGGLNDVAARKADLREVIEAVPGRNYALCSLGDPGVGSRVAINVEMLAPALAQIREQFDLVVIDAPPMVHGILGSALSRLADGVILVVEAERTRTPVVGELQRVIEANGGKILGVVLNKRRFRIPRFLYRWL
jgi:Mrp family chromosome partitioning ATPase